MADLENDNEIVPEDLDDSVVAEESSQVSLKKLRERLKECEGKAKEYLDGWQRAQAEFVNVRKRDEESKSEFVRFATSDLVSQLILVLDSLELSLPHGNKELEVIYKQLLSVLKSAGLDEVSPLHQPFDPKHHESIGVIPTENPEEDNEVLEVLQKGYILAGKTLRPAKVRIGEYKINRY